MPSIEIADLVERLCLHGDGRFTCIDLEASRVQLSLSPSLRQENLSQIRKTLERYAMTKGRFAALEAAYLGAFENGAKPAVVD